MVNENLVFQLPNNSVARSTSVFVQSQLLVPSAELKGDIQKLEETLVIIMMGTENV